MPYIYILKLESNKYYIGKTDNSSFKLRNYSNDYIWTRRYKPIKILFLIQNDDINKYIFLYMEIYGINNVRGGDYCELILSEENIISIKKEIGRNNNS